MEEERDPSLTEGIAAYHVFHRDLHLRGASYPLYLWSAVAACRRLRAVGFPPELIHAHVYAAAVPGAMVATRAGIPLVLTEHFSGVALRSLSRVEARKARYACEHAARVLPVSRYLQEAIKGYGIDVPFEVVPNVVDTSLFRPAEGKKKAEDEGRRLLFVGNLDRMEYKGFPTLVQALVRLNERRRDWRLDVIGTGSERRRYETSVGALGLVGQVTFHGAQMKPVIAQMMRVADLLVAPSRMETFGAVVAEALASGLPVVSTSVGGIPELVDDRSGRLVSPDDPAALAETLDATLEDLDTFDGRAIAAAARDRYGLEVVGKQLDRIYASAVAESRGGAARTSQAP
jgi:glycosyltransferase involved in cell wall biosynthesis